MAELLAYLARELVDDPGAVRVDSEERDGALVLLLHVAPDDVGKVIGRGGRIVRALRTVVRASSARDGRRVLVEIAGLSGAERVVDRPGRPSARRSTARSSSRSASDDARWFKVGSRLLAGGAEAEVVVARRGAGGRPVIRLDRAVARGTLLEVPARGAARRPRRTSTTPSSWSGSRSSRRAGAASGGSPTCSRASRTTRSTSATALLLPLVAACVLSRRSRGGTYPCRSRILRPRLTASFAPRCLHPRSACLRLAHRAAPGRGSARRRARPAALLLPRHDARSSGGSVDDEPYGGGAGMVLRVDVVAAALDAAYGGQPAHRVVALTPAGPPADAGTGGGAREGGALDAPLRPLRGLRRADRRAPLHRLDLDRAVRAVERRPAGDGAASTRSRAGCPGALARGLGRARRASPTELDGRLEYPHYTRPAEFRGWRVPDVLLSGDHGRIESWRKEHVR